MSAFEPSGLVKSFRSGGGEVTLWFPKGNIVAGRIAGHVRGGLAAAALVRWNLAHRAEASRLDLLTGSLLAHIAIRALGTILGGRLVAHEERVTFEAAYTTALAQRCSVRPRAEA